MTRVMKKILISVFGAIGFLFAGFFIAGCGVDYSQIRLVADQSVVNLEVGESVNVVFTFENYQSGFSNRVQANSNVNGQNSIFSVSDPVYLNDSSFRVTITATAGGEGQLIMRSLEADKQCVVDVSVSQFSSSINFNGDLLYLSDDTDFVPSADMLTFDVNTTEKGVSFFYLQPGDEINFTTFRLENFDQENMTATFSDGTETLTRNLTLFDSASLQPIETEDGQEKGIVFSYNGEAQTTTSMVNQFEILAIYEGAMTSNAGQNLIYDVGVVNVLPSLNVQVSGGYLLPDNSIEFSEESLENIIIVPNNTNMTQYLIKIEMIDAIDLSNIVMNVSQNNENVVIDFYDATSNVNLETAPNIQYLIVSQNSIVQSETELYLNIFYDIAQGVDDDSVNVDRTYEIETQIAPSMITVNDLSTPETLHLYTHYTSPSYGWNELFINVLSGFATSPNFEGIYFTFNSDQIDMSHNGTPVTSGRSRLYTDLENSFLVRGKGTDLTAGEIQIHLQSNILEHSDSDTASELILSIPYVMTEGASKLFIEDGYDASNLYLDMTGGVQSFSHHIYANSEFQNFTFQLMGGEDCVDFLVGDEPYIYENGNYYLNFSVVPMFASETGGRYHIILDNGTYFEVIFKCINTLKGDSTSIQLSSSGNDNVTASSFERTGNADFDNVLNIEIQNASSNGEITFGRVANFEILANVASEDIRFSYASANISVLKTNNAFTVTTRGNGEATINITLMGQVVENFAPIARNYEVVVNVSSYSLVDEFSLMNGGSYALNNVIYCGTNVTEENSTITFNTRVRSEQSRNFYQYHFNPASIMDFFENSREGQTYPSFSITSANFENYISETLMYETYDDKFVYFYPLDNSGNLFDQVSTTMTIRKTYTNEEGILTVEPKTVQVFIYNGLMFFAEDFTYEQLDDNQQVVATYSVSFSNVFRIGAYGDFDLNSFSYQHDLPQEDSFVLSAYLRQRNSTKRYDAHIEIRQYYSVESITLLSNLSQINFTNQNLTAVVGVALYPTYSTNSDVNPRVEFVTTNGNPFTNMLTWSVQSNGNGVFVITLSCERFFEEHQDEIVTFEDISLTGRVYIYPPEWGTSVSAINPSLQPLEIDVHYRNGSRTNPYLIENAEDVLEINTNQTTLQSHYEISTIVDMSSVRSGALPIGVLENSDGTLNLYGFRGSITATTSQAGIVNLAIKHSSTESNFAVEIDGVLYAGLFAQIDEDMSFENFSVAGSVNVSYSGTAYVGILSSVNYGRVENVEASLDGESLVSISNGTLYFGAITAVNLGEIVQDFTKYEGTGYTYKRYVASTTGLNVANFADENAEELLFIVDENGDKEIVDDIGFVIVEVAEIQTDGEIQYVQDGEETFRVDARGFVIDDDGNLVKFDETGAELSYLHDYTGQTSKNLTFFENVLNINVANATVYAGGVAGVTANQISRISPYSNDYKLYGYTGYTAYTLFNISGSNAENNEVYVGGIVGVASNFANTSSIIPDLGVSATGEGYALENLLVGGEINTFGMTGVDNVGGILGAVDTVMAGPINIYENTSRVYLRGNQNVGGIVGSEIYHGNAAEIIVNYGNANRVEAVDDARGEFYASNLIRTTAPNWTSQVSGNVLSGLAGDDLFEIVSIGNVGSETNNRIYADGTFSAVSYSVRNVLDIPEEAIASNSASTTTYYGDFMVVVSAGNEEYSILGAVGYPRQSVTLDLSDENGFALTPVEDNIDINVFLAFYFHVSSDLTGNLGASAQEQIEDLNFITPNSNIYPFVLDSQDVGISSTSSNNLLVDNNGNITIRGTGLAEITLSSILNTNVSQVIYLYIVNFFDSNVSSSIFYTDANLNSGNLQNGSELTIYGNAYTTIYALPTYDLSGETANGEEFYISRNGILTYQNVGYLLTPNTEFSVDVVAGEGNTVSTADGSKQSVIFHRVNGAEPNDVADTYTLTPILRVEVGGHTFFYTLDGAEIDLEVFYENSATRIEVARSYESMESNGSFENTVSITSTNRSELLFYEITGPNGIVVQSRVPERVGDYVLDGVASDLSYDEYLNTCTSDDLFNVQFTRRTGTNIFDLVCKINPNSEAYQNRYADGANIFGEYVVVFYSSELRPTYQNPSAVSCTMRFRLDEATLNYININNYSNINDVSSTDAYVVPSQRGILEISLDPYDAVFNTFTISNDEINTTSGATNASFTFAYEKRTQTGVTYQQAPNFGVYENNSLSFTYQELTDFYTQLADEGITYTGRIFISYYMPSSGVVDNAPVAFNVEVSYVGDAVDPMTTTIELQTKLGSYARLVFDDKEAIGDHYYLAKGLAYDLTLELFGYSEDQVEITLSNNDYASISGSNGRYVLQINNGNINYSSSAPGFAVTITVSAEKIVDGVLVPYESEIDFYIMEFVLNYSYDEGVNEDIVEGMENGVISTAVGNPYELEIAIRDFLEYDSTNASVNAQVETFIENMRNNLQWNVYEGDWTQTLALGQTFESPAGYYRISSFTFTPQRIYDHERDLYYFSVDGHYTMQNGTYTYSPVALNSNRFYTEFTFDVHDQSTQDSPIPVYDYEDFIGMEEGQWYILMNDISLPSSEDASMSGEEQFAPITTQIAGLDGNNKTISFADTYVFDGLTNVGLFAEVASGTILQNIYVQITADVNFRMNVQTFNVGLLAGTNNGIITNCEVESVNGSALSVVSTVTTSSSYVAGLVARNSGYITNSRSRLNVYSNVNLSGFVGVNTGHIASSYFRGASLRNNTNTATEYTAGFVVNNTGEIYTSYVSGERVGDQNEMYYVLPDNQAQENTIMANGNISGFVYSNGGTVADSYSNIHLEYSGFFASGFVYDNTGLVERCFSTSTLESGQTRNYGFARSNNVQQTDDAVGIYDCFYLSDDTDEVINMNLGRIPINDYTEIDTLTKAEFSDMDNFDDWVVAEGRDTNSVWFLNTNSLDSQNFGGTLFNVGRPELVAPNIEAESERRLLRTEDVYDAETGASYVRYVYEYTGYSLGSEYNPILISDAEEMENYITQENSSTSINTRYYRLIADVDYSSILYNSSLYKTRFMGYFEGNFMDVDNISLIGSSPATYAGLFAEIGSSTFSGAIGTVMNFNLNPTNVDFANTQVVGAITGRVDGGTVLNVSLLNGQGITIVGNNIVGGAIGIAVGDYKLQNVYSTYSAKARQQVADNVFDQNATSFSTNSYAGSVVGVLSGTGLILNCVTDEVVSAIADEAGLLFGLIDSGATVDNVDVAMDAEMSVNGYSYAGLVAGESKGTLTDVTILGTGSVFTNFVRTPEVPIAVGGVVGLASGGTISDITMEQDISISTISTDGSISALGGIAGQISEATTMDVITINADLTGYSLVGGIVGLIETTGRTTFNHISFTGELNAIGIRQEMAAIGGLAGSSGQDTIIALGVENEVESGEYTNNFNITSSSVQVNLYATTAEYAVGTIVGLNRSSTSHMIYNTYSNLANCSVSVINLSLQNESELTGTAILDTSDGIIDYSSSDSSIEGSRIFNTITMPGTNCVYELAISYTTLRNNGSFTSLQINLWGNGNIVV